MHKNLLKIGRIVPEIWPRTDKHTQRQTDTLITILRAAYRGRSKNTNAAHRQQLPASTLHTSSTTTTHAADDDDTSRLVALAAQREWQCIQTTTQKNRSQLSFAAIFFSTWQKLANFFTYIRPKESRSIIYNSVYLILACVENFTATVTLYVLCWPVE